MVLRENYFGAFTQYSTTREYLAGHERGLMPGDPLELKYRLGKVSSSTTRNTVSNSQKSNVFHLDLSVLASDSVVCVPAGLPGFESCYDVDGERLSDVGAGLSAIYVVPELQTLLRLHDYFVGRSPSSIS